MTTITEALTVEHTLLNFLFDDIFRLLPDVQTVHELRLLTRLVEGALARHADLEDNLAYSALNQALAEKGKLDQLQLDHQELDERLHGAGVATEVAEAVRLLKAGLNASRQHFRWEERTIFPLFDKLFAPASLEALGAGATGRLGMPGAAPSARLRHATALVGARQPPRPLPVGKVFGEVRRHAHCSVTSQSSA